MKKLTQAERQEEMEWRKFISKPRKVRMVVRPNSLERSLSRLRLLWVWLRTQECDDRVEQRKHIAFVRNLYIDLATVMAASVRPRGAPEKPKRLILAMDYLLRKEIGGKAAAAKLETANTWKVSQSTIADCVTDLRNKAENEIDLLLTIESTSREAQGKPAMERGRAVAALLKTLPRELEFRMRKLRTRRYSAIAPT